LQGETEDEIPKSPCIIGEGKLY